MLWCHLIGALFEKWSGVSRSALLTTFLHVWSSCSWEGVAGAPSLDAVQTACCPTEHRWPLLLPFLSPLVAASGLVPSPPVCTGLVLYVVLWAPAVRPTPPFKRTGLADSVSMKLPLYSVSVPASFCDSGFGHPRSSRFRPLCFSFPVHVMSSRHLNPSFKYLQLVVRAGACLRVRAAVHIS